MDAVAGSRPRQTTRPAHGSPSYPPRSSQSQRNGSPLDQLMRTAQLRKQGTLPEDEERAAESRLQRLTDKHVAEVDENLKRKEQELSEV